MLCDRPGLVMPSFCLCRHVEKDLMLCDCPGLVMLSFCLCRHSTLRKTSCCVTVLVHGPSVCVMLCLSFSCCPSVCVDTLR